MATGMPVRLAEATTPTVESLALRRATLWALLGSKVLSGWGTMWDIQWHLLIGRDSFWIAPHVMIYAGVTLSVFLCFGLLAWETWLGYRGAPPRDAIRVLGLMGTRGFHLAAWGIALTVLAAPVDDVWHRLFGIDVTLWSPPHLMGIFGGTVNALGCLVIAREVYPAGSFPEITGVVLGGVFVYGGLDLVLRPAIRIAYLYGGVRFYTFAVLGALLLPLALIVTARASRVRWAPLGLLLVLLPIGMAGNAVAQAGFAWLQPVSFIQEEIAKDPGAPIAVAHAIARKEGTTPGQLAGALSLVGIVPAAVMVVADPRRRPLAATLVYAVALFASDRLVPRGAAGARTDAARRCRDPGRLHAHAPRRHRCRPSRESAGPVAGRRALRFSSASRAAIMRDGRSHPPSARNTSWSFRSKASKMT